MAIIDTEIYDNYFDYFVERVLEVREKISHKLATSVCYTESPAANSTNQEH